MKMIIDKKIFVTAETDDNRVKSQMISRKEIGRTLNHLNERNPSDITSGLTDLDGILGNQYSNNNL